MPHPYRLAVLLVLALPCAARTAEPTDGERLFRDQVRPLLVGKCLSCHGDKKRGGLDLTRRAALLRGGDGGPGFVPGRPDESLLVRKLAAREMPPKNPLTPEQVDAFRRWVAAGAPFLGEPLSTAGLRAGSDWWSLQPVRRPQPPPVRNPAWSRTPVDRFLLARLEAAGLAPAPEADRRTLLRRVTFDLTGLPPTPAEVDDFLADSAADAYERRVDRLLASPGYGERWGRHWLDIVRFAESHGYEMNTLRPNAWPYRDYVIRAFNDGIPYPQFIREQLAGDALPGADGLTQAATGFLVGGAHDMVGNSTEEGRLQQRMDDLDDLVTTAGATFLGLTVNCARCHDHKFDPVTMRDYYGLQAVFTGVQHAERPLRMAGSEDRRREAERLRAELAQFDRDRAASEPVAEPSRSSPARPPVHPRRNVDRFAPTEARFLRFTVERTADGSQPCIDELEVYTAETTPRNVALASAGATATASSIFPNNPLHQLAHLHDGRHGNSRSWISNEPARGWVMLEFPRTERIDRVVWGRDREEKFRDRLATTYRIEVASSPGAWRLVASASDRRPYVAGAAPERSPRQEELARRLAALEEVVPVYAGTFATAGPTHVLERGDPLLRGESVAPSALAVVRPPLTLDPSAPEQERRLALARWLGEPDNPLTARVLVNRVWQYHFGQGIVNTPSDFGFNGDRPSHPELLDWLASEFMAGGWRWKPLHRLLVLSSAYRQSSRADARGLAVDRGNRLLWRMAPRRLEAEALRDAILAVSGRLDRRMGGPGYSLWEKNTNYVVVFRPKTELGPEEFRRMVYQFKPRSQQDPTFGVFDCPDAALAKPRRTASTTVLQALNLLNGPAVVSQAEEFAERLRREEGTDAARQVRRAFALAFGRSPTTVEAVAAEELVRRHGPAALCRAIYNANEFLHVD